MTSPETMPNSELTSEPRDIRTTTSAIEVDVTWPLPGLARLEHTDPGARAANMATNAYMLVNSTHRALLVDAAFDHLLPAVQDVLQQGSELVGLAFTHRHPVEHGGDVVRRLAQAFGVPIFLHPRDMAALRRVAAGLEFKSPVGSDVMEAFELEVVPFPGHTEGHVIYYRASDQLLLAGDAAMGPTREQAAGKVERLIRPPFSFNTDDEQLRRGWAAFNRPVRQIFPYHGAVYTGRSVEEMTRVMEPLQRSAPTRGLNG